MRTSIRRGMYTSRSSPELEAKNRRRQRGSAALRAKPSPQQCSLEYPPMSAPKARTPSRKAKRCEGLEQLVFAAEDSGNRFVGEDVHDRLREQAAHAEDGHLLGLLALVDRDRVGDDDALDLVACVDLLERRV